jgi:hypothetical protein
MFDSKSELPVMALLAFTIMIVNACPTFNIMILNEWTIVNLMLKWSRGS